MRFTVCGCPDPNCGGWHTILTERRIPSLEEYNELLRSKANMSGTGRVANIGARPRLCENSPPNRELEKSTCQNAHS